MIGFPKHKLHPFNGLHGLFDCDCACAAPPDYAPVAAASKESAEVMAQLGREQLAEAKRQYDQNYAVAQPVIQAQLGLMNESLRQGQDYYDYMVANQRPVEAALNADAMSAGSDAMMQYRADQALADAQQGYTRALNQAFRQARRYGLNPVMPVGSMLTQQAQQSAAAMTGAREKERALGYAKKMVVAGLYRGLPGASQGAYGLALNSGNAAVANQMAPGSTYMAGLGQGANTIGMGQQMQLQGLGNVLNAQTSYANSINQNMAAQGSNSGLGAALGAASNIALTGAVLGWWSDRRLKENIELVGRDERTGLNLYEFSYKDDPEKRRYRGVMADEVESRYPEAVVYDDMGYASVNYDMLGLELVGV